MKIFSLSAMKPIVKKYVRDKHRQLQKTPYPLVSEFTSTDHDVTTIESLYAVIQATANMNGCLIKGELLKPLNKESRAGSTDKDQPTEWLCLDLDGVHTFATPEDLLQAISCDDVDYVLQWSSSMGIENKSDLRCHLFLLLDKPVAAARLKNWLLSLNLGVKVLHDQTVLAKSGNALRWPLDVSTCQNDKLIYVAPPKLGTGIKDPFPGGNRIQLVKRGYERLTIDTASIPTPDVLRVTIDKRVQELRELAGMPKRKKGSFKFHGTIEYFAGAAAATITEMKTERGFTYLNLNGGDSWAYYHPEHNAEFIFNFKGEPTYKTEELLPEYWSKMKAQANTGSAQLNGHTYIAFCERTTGRYWKAIYEASSDTLELDPAPTVKHVTDFLKARGLPSGDFVPEWAIDFDPHSSHRVDQTNRRVNTYTPAGLWATNHVPSKSLPFITARIIHHVLGGDPATIEAFLNWIACIFQYKERTQTAWILHGTQGTGKGILFHSILAPIIGVKYTKARRFDELDSNFVDFVDGVFLTMIDEIQQSHHFWASKVTSKLKNLIVEPFVNSRLMYTATKSVKNYNNLIFASNKTAPVDISPDDRRFNVGVYQPQRLSITRKEVEDLLPLELPQVYGYFMSRPADKDKARVPHINLARSKMIQTNMLSIDRIVQAINDGDIAYLWDQLPAEKSPLSVPSSPQAFKLVAYTKLITNIVKNGATHISRDDLYTICDYCVDDMPKTPHKFTSLLRHHKIDPQPLRIGPRVVRGIVVQWKIDPTWHKNALNEIAQGLV